MPELGGVTIDPQDIEVRSMRELYPTPATTHVGSYDMSCVECHGLFESPQDPPAQLAQHQHIVLDHGMNDRCLNCHSREDRAQLVLHGEKSLSFDEVEQLCAKCHGPTYRDWERGIHGRTNGYWDENEGEQVRLTCTQCHDPHAPAFPGIAPLPGPQTLRMGDQSPHHGHLGDPSDPSKHSPLQRAYGPHHGSASPAVHPEHTPG